jgi:hypothetical protein
MLHRSTDAIVSLALTLSAHWREGGKVQLRRALSTRDVAELSRQGWIAFARPIRSGRALRWQVCYAPTPAGDAAREELGAALADAYQRTGR